MSMTTRAGCSSFQVVNVGRADTAMTSEVVPSADSTAFIDCSVACFGDWPWPPAYAVRPLPAPAISITAAATTSLPLLPTTASLGARPRTSRPVISVPPLPD